MMEPDFSGEYRLTCVADASAAELSLTDKPCWRIEGPGGLRAIVWTWTRNPQKILSEFLDGTLKLDLQGGVEPVVFSVPHAKPPQSS